MRTLASIRLLTRCFISYISIASSRLRTALAFEDSTPGARSAGTAVLRESRSTGARAETRTRGGRERCGLGIAFTKRKPNARIVSECVTSSGSKKNSLPRMIRGHSTEHRRCWLGCARRGRAQTGDGEKKEHHDESQMNAIFMS